MLILAIIIILILIVVIIVTYHELHCLHKKIEKKSQTGSKIRLTKHHALPLIDQLYEDYNRLFDHNHQAEQRFLRERHLLDQTIHNISHDIRTPLTVSWGYCKQLLRNDPYNPNLQKIDQSLGNVSNRLEYLLEYQSLLEKNIEPEYSRLNLSEILRQHLMNFYDIFTQMNFDVEIYISDHIWIQCDPDILDRILTNLLGNIAKHGQKRIIIHLEAHQNVAKLTLANQVKHDIQNIHKLTQRFYAEDLSSSEKSSGLGLYITEHLIELTQGHLQLSYHAPTFIASITWPKDY